ncbi:L-threonylcarbamoyladenylate synthase [Candidatus Dependentiae bacterium]|nr:L-threonylcarbamoyladenylate synthase [Candidatus Dependentiae bacterium]MCC7414756.1 L-threonylcarbamoyladenylate synthase [Campylobacterota bacterium]
MTQNKLSWQNPDSINLLEQALASDQAVLLSSDTVLGLSAPLTKSGFETLNRIKGREKKPYLIVLADKQQLGDYCEIPANQAIQRLIEKCWPGPLTLILPAKKGIGSHLTHGGTSIAIRIPAHKELLGLLNRVGGLFSTSANKAGCAVPETIAQVDPTIIGQVGLVVIDERTSTLPSTILDCTNAQIHLVREGAYDRAELEKLSGIIFKKT